MTVTSLLLVVLLTIAGRYLALECHSGCIVHVVLALQVGAAALLFNVNSMAADYIQEYLLERLGGQPGRNLAELKPLGNGRQLQLGSSIRDFLFYAHNDDQFKIYHG